MSAAVDLRRMPFVRTANEFAEWLASAPPLDFCIYHRGQLAADGEYDNELTTLSIAVARRHHAGTIDLFQKRVGATPAGETVGTIAYLAQKRRARA
jgi:hypothetical protein